MQVSLQTVLSLTILQHLIALDADGIGEDHGYGQAQGTADHLNRVEQRQEQAAKAFATKLDQHARKASADFDRESKKFEQRIVKLEKRIADLERRLRKAK